MNIQQVMDLARDVAREAAHNELPKNCRSAVVLAGLALAAVGVAMIEKRDMSADEFNFDLNTLEGHAEAAVQAGRGEGDAS